MNTCKQLGLLFYCALWAFASPLFSKPVTLISADTVNCQNLIFTGSAGIITVSGLTATYDKVEIIGRNTNWQIVTICDGNCSDTQIIPNLQAGEYIVKVSQGGSDGSYCYREEKVMVSSSGGTADCANLTFTASSNQITVSGLTASYDKIEILGKNTNWQVVTVCDGNCAETQVIPNLQAVNTPSKSIKAVQTGRIVTEKNEFLLMMYLNLRFLVN